MCAAPRRNHRSTLCARGAWTSCFPFRIPCVPAGSVHPSFHHSPRPLFPHFHRAFAARED